MSGRPGLLTTTGENDPQRSRVGRIRRRELPEHRPESGSALLRLDVRFADDAAVFLVLFANVRAEIRPAGSDRIESLWEELGGHLRRIQRRHEQRAQVRDRFLRGPRWRDYT